MVVAQLQVVMSDNFSAFFGFALCSLPSGGLGLCFMFDDLTGPGVYHFLSFYICLPLSCYDLLLRYPPLNISTGCGALLPCT